MHVCILYDRDFTLPGGAERLIGEEARYYAAEGFDVTLAARRIDPDAVEELELGDGVDMIEYPGHTHVGSRVRHVASVLRRTSADAALTHYTEPETYLALQVLGSGVPVASHVHGTPLWFANDPGVVPHARNGAFERLVREVPGHREFHDDLDLGIKRRIMAEVTEFLRRRGLDSSALVTTGSRRVREEISALYGADARVVRPGVSESWLRGCETTPVRRLTEYEHTVVSVSRLDQRKRLGLLVRAIAEIADVGLVICGTGPDRERLERLGEKLDVSDRVTFAGYVPEEELPAYHKSADVFACAAWMSYGLAPLEAYGMHTKVALSSDTYVNEVFGGCPGVAVADPTVESWVGVIGSLLDTDEPPIDVDAVPTWREFCETRHRLLEERGVL